MNKKQTIIQIEGVVQGVGFRYATLEKAREIGLSGYVRNLSNGHVEILMIGSEEQQQTLLQWLKKGGPRLARITKVTSAPIHIEEEITDFIIK